MTATSQPVTLLLWWEVPWVCGNVAGIRHVRAPDARSAEHDVERHPADFGLPHESVIVGDAVRLAAPIADDPL
jgi:hypothetical protein